MKKLNKIINNVIKADIEGKKLCMYGYTVKHNRQ